MKALTTIGAFGVFAPKSHGGMEFDFPSDMKVVTELSKIEGPVGEDGMIASASTFSIAA